MTENPTVAALLGATIGFALSAIGSIGRDWRRQWQQRRGVRLLVSTEVDQNLRLLRELWERLQEKEQDRRNKGVPEKRLAVDRAYHLSQSPFPAWRHRLWESQAAALPASLSGQEIVQVHRFHDRLDELTAIRVELARIAEDDDEERRAEPPTPDPTGMFAPMRMGSVAQRFPRYAPALMQKFDKIADDILGQGIAISVERKAYPWWRFWTH